jgi:hypothetical protein
MGGIEHLDVSGSKYEAPSEGVTMVSGNSSASGSGPLTTSEWAAIVSSIAFAAFWLGMSFA